MKKRIIAILCLAVLFAGMIPMTAMAAGKTRYVYTDNGKTLNLRREPKINVNNVIAQIPFGASVTLLDSVGLKDWAYINYNGYTGYVMNRYLVTKKPVTPTPAPAPDVDAHLYAKFEPADYDVEVRASTPGGHVNLRWAPTKQASVYEKIADGTRLHVIAEGSSWAQVIDLETYTIGFMMKSFLKTIESDG